MNLNLGELGTQARLATGDPCFCSGCGAGLSGVSARTGGLAAKTTGGDDDDATHTWHCEFCGVDNDLDLDPEEMPTATETAEAVDTVDYVLMAAPDAAALQRSVSSEENTVIFVIDISGSMCMSQEVEGRVNLKGDRTADMQSLLTQEDGGMHGQWMPGQRRNVTYVSRLQAVQAAVEAQITDMAANNPNRPVGIVTFNNEVVIYGDGSGDPLTIAGDRLSNFEQLTEAGAQFALQRTVGDSRDDLVGRVFGLNETGPTALGPAVIAAVSMVSRMRGAKVVVCTDGLANVGLGSLDVLETDEQRDAAEEFYTRVGLFAAEAGVTIDVIGIQGDDCDLENLGTMAESCGGEVTLVNQLELTQNFSGILADAVVATNTRVTMQLHRGLKFKDDAESPSQATREVGNVTANTEVSFEFAPLTRAERNALENPLPEDLADMPFQVRVHYTRLDGVQCVRVITQSRPVTRDRHRAERSMHHDVLGAHVAQKCASLASAGNYQQSRVTSRAWSNFMGRNQHTAEQQEAYTNFNMDLARLDSAVEHAEAEESSAGLLRYESDEDEPPRRLSRLAEEGEGLGPTEGFAAKIARRNARGKARKQARSRNDGLSSQIRQFKKKGAASYTPTRK